MGPWGDAEEMIVPSSKLSKYLPSIKFPVQVLQPIGDRIAFIVTRPQLEELISLKSVFGVGTYKRIRRLRLYAAVYEKVVLRIRCRPFAEDNKTSFLAGRTWMLHLRRCRAYSPETRGEFR